MCRGLAHEAAAWRFIVIQTRLPLCSLQPHQAYLFFARPGCRVPGDGYFQSYIAADPAHSLFLLNPGPHVPEEPCDALEAPESGDEHTSRGVRTCPGPRRAPIRRVPRVRTVMIRPYHHFRYSGNSCRVNQAGTVRVLYVGGVKRQSSPDIKEGLGNGWFPRLLGSVRCSCGWDTRDFCILMSASILIAASTTCWLAIGGSGRSSGSSVTPRAPVSLWPLTST